MFLQAIKDDQLLPVFSGFSSKQSLNKQRRVNRETPEIDIFLA